MAYATSNPPAMVSQRLGAASGSNLWVYADEDVASIVLAADYFSNGSALGMKVGDPVLLVNSTNGSVKLARVTSVTSGGAATVSLNNTQELTASGAVTPGVTIVELNHATVVVAATIADASEHAGLLIVKDTSASGIAAHTLTLTAGTFDGTNSVATLNAPGEQLTVFIDDTGNGVIIQNTGAVALS